MRRIVVGFDGSEQARDALALADVLRGRDGEELTVAVVDSVEPLLGEAAQSTEARESKFERCREAAAEQLGRSSFVHQTATGAAPAALEQIARDAEADLIVLGSTHRGRLGRVLPGSVGERLLQGSPCAVAVAPNGYAEHAHPAIALVGVGYDASPEASVARREAEALARHFDAQLRLIGVAAGAEGSGRGGTAATSPGATPRRRIAAGLEAGAAACAPDIDVETVLEEGDPAAALAGQGVELDLLILGSRRHGPLRTVLLGGVAWDTVRLAPCPVLVVPRGAHLESPAAPQPGSDATRS